MSKRLLLSVSLALAAYVAPAQWTKLTTKTYTDLELTDVHAYQGKIIATAFRFGDFQGIILKSLDDGKSWDTMEIPPKGFLFKTIAFKDPDTGYIGGYGSITVILRTTDGGQNWSYYLDDAANAGINDMHFLNDKVGVASGYGYTQFSTGQCYRTYDGGATWNSIAKADLGCLDTLPMDYLQFVDARTGYGRADFLLRKSIMKTTDSGKSWTLQYTHTTGLVGFHFWNVDNGIFIDISGQVFKTTDGGQNWGPVSSNLPTTAIWLSMAFLNQTTGFIAGDGGKIYKTTDAGKTWVKQTGASGTLRRIRFCENRGYAVADNGAVFRSDILPNNVDEVLPLREQLNIYPNPANDVVHISSYNGMYKNIEATITDISGRVLKYGSSDNGALQLQVSELSPGIYTLVLKADKKETSTTICITR